MGPSEHITGFRYIKILRGYIAASAKRAPVLLLLSALLLLLLLLCEAQAF
jgi:hypothetical protein